ncbi:MAG: hypothetical protein KGQ79_01215 [Proteobacteria bacterium]|nr:hypothetical protein [Pseudomonadota bacterium]MDE2239457.1 hypothetical protein [Rhodospirillales bacterium]
MALEEVFPDYAAHAAAGFAGLCCPRRTVMIAFTPRAGSTHLCAALHQAGQLAEPNEIFNPRGPARQESQRRKVSLFSDYIASFAAGPDETFIFKTCWQDVAPLAPALTRLFPDLHVVYLTRRNDAAQAVSAFKAEVNGQWHRRQGDAPARPLTEADFSMQRILTIHGLHIMDRRGWAGWFAAQGISPLRLVYEDFEEDVNIALRVLVPALGLKLHQEVPPGTGYEKLADRLSLDWTQKLLGRLLNLS